MDIFGKSVAIKSEKQKNEYSLDFSGFPKGVYLIHIKTDQKVHCEKIVLQ